MADPIPVCFVSSDAQLGGAELYLQTLLENLGSQWIDQVVVLGEGPFVERLRSGGFSPTVVPCAGRAGWPAAVLRLRRIFRTHSTRLVHANGPKAALLTTLAATWTGTRVVWHKQDAARDGRVGRWVARRCEVVVGVSVSALGSFDGAAGVRSRVVRNGIVPRTVDRADARQALRSELDVPNTGQVVALVGRLHPGKGQLDLLAVASQLRERIPEIRLVLAGAGDPHEPEYEQTVRRRIETDGFEDFVHLLGFREDAVALIAGCDLLASPSLTDPTSGWREGCSLVALEAMSVGTPLVGYADPSIVETVGSCARLVESGDRAALADAIADLLESPGEAARIAACGRRRVQKFRLDDAVERMKETYLAVMA